MGLRAFECKTYKDLIRCLAHERSISLKDLSAAAGIHPPFLTRVLRGDAHLNDQQLNDICSELGLDQEELNYAHLLWRHDRAYRNQYRSRLHDEIVALRRKTLKLSKRLKTKPAVASASEPGAQGVTEYYQTPLMQIIHMAFQIPRFQTDPSLLQKELGISKAEFHQLVEHLVAIKFVKKLPNGYRSVMANTHLEEGSALSKMNHKLWRLEAMVWEQLRRVEDSYRFTAAISADEAAFEGLKETLKKTIADFAANIADTPPSAVFQLNLDLIPILTP